MLGAEEKSFDPSAIRKAVQDAGFTPGEIRVTAAGSSSKDEDFWVLEMSGPPGRLVLAAGAEIEELQSAEALGKRIRVTGMLHPSHADHPPGLTVEEWTLAGSSEEDMVDPPALIDDRVEFGGRSGHTPRGKRGPGTSRTSLRPSGPRR